MCDGCRRANAGIIDAVIDDLPEQGRGFIVAGWLGTAIFVVTAVLSAATSSMRIVGVVTALALFAAGIYAFALSFARGVNRSRVEEISVVGLYFLVGGCVPEVARRHLMAALTVQVVAAFATASARPFTAVAFGILVPMYGLGMAGLWAATHGTFPKRRKLRPKKMKK